MKFWDVEYTHKNGGRGRVYDVPAESTEEIRLKMSKLAVESGTEIEEIWIDEKEVSR